MLSHRINEYEVHIMNSNKIVHIIVKIRIIRLRMHISAERPKESAQKTYFDHLHFKFIQK